MIRIWWRGLAAGTVLVGLGGCGSIVTSADPGPITTIVPGPTLKIGFLGPLTGPNATLGTVEYDGARLAVQQYQADHPGVTVTLDVADTAGGTGRAAAGALRLARAHVLAVIGPATPSEAASADPVLARAGIPSLTMAAVPSVAPSSPGSSSAGSSSPGSSSPGASSPGGVSSTSGAVSPGAGSGSGVLGSGVLGTGGGSPGGGSTPGGGGAPGGGSTGQSQPVLVHRLVAGTSTAGADIAAFVSRQSATSVAVVGDGTTSAAPLLSALRSALGTAGVNDVLDTSIRTQGLGTTAAAAKIVGANPDAVVFAGDAATGGLLVDALRSASYGGVIVLAGAAGDPAAAQGAAWVTSGAEAYLACGCDDPASATSTTALAYVDSYRGAFGVAPPEWSAQAFDAVNTVLSTVGPSPALGASTTTTTMAVGPYAPTASAVASALGTVSYAGVSGTISFTAAGSLQGAALWISQAKGGQITQIGRATSPTSASG